VNLSMNHELSSSKPRFLDRLDERDEDSAPTDYSASGRVLLGSTATPGPMVVENVILRR
jgi:hypothetical protein